MVKQLSQLLLTIAVFLSVACGGSDKTGTISQEELLARINDNSAPIILDTRTPEEFARGHVPGAINVPVTEMENNIQQLDLAFADEIVVYCEVGGRAKQAQRALKSNGYFEVRHLAGDMNKWRQARLPCTGC